MSLRPAFDYAARSYPERREWEIATQGWRDRGKAEGEKSKRKGRKGKKRQPPNSIWDKLLNYLIALLGYF